MRSTNEYLLERIDGVSASQRRNADPWLTEDLEDLLVEVGEYLATALDLPKLETELAGQARLDHDALRWVTDELSAIADRTPTAFALNLPSGEPIPWQERLERLRAIVAELATPEAVAEFAVQLTIRLIGRLFSGRAARRIAGGSQLQDGT
ncbi:MAG: hypothetical protein IT459_12390 [Planctomycetes bacterium]|nr:hypothetical protein [Planctomycetota bacterium]